MQEPTKPKPNFRPQTHRPHVAPPAEMDAEQAYRFDVNGFIVVRGVLGEGELLELRELAKPVEAGNMESMLHEKIYRDTMCHPKVTPIIKQLCGENYRLDHLNIHTHVAAGYKGGGLHGGHHPGAGAGFYQLLNGSQFLNGLISVTYELYDTHCNNGGFCCIPGSHKAGLVLPADWRDLSKGVSDAVHRVPASAGDCIIFTEALVHGTLPWTASTKRSTLFYKYNAQGCAWSADFYDPEEYAAYEDMTEERLSLLEPPNARYSTREERLRRTFAPRNQRAAAKL